MGPAIRSLLFCPGDSEKLIGKALASSADAVIVDLEDAVAPESKQRAREVSAEVLSADTPSKPVVVRVNAFDTGMTAGDLAAVMACRPWGVMLPKSGGADDVQRLSHYLDALEARDGIALGTTRILTVATETAAATLNLTAEHEDKTGRLWGMLWGGEDLSATLGAQSNREPDGSYSFPYQYARSQCLFAASAIGVTAIDSVYTDIRDPDGLRQEARIGLRDGFSAKAAIHPAQVDIINEVMTPTSEQLEWAHQVVELLRDTGVARLDGKMVDIAHKRIAQRLLERAAAFA